MDKGRTIVARMVHQYHWMQKVEAVMFSIGEKIILGTVSSDDIDGMIDALQDLKRRLAEGEESSPSFLWR